LYGDCAGKKDAGVMRCILNLSLKFSRSMSESINKIQDEIIEEFSLFDNWQDKYEHLISMAKELSPMEEKYKTEDNFVRGCQARVWLHAYMENGVLKFLADSDALITKGLVALMVRVLSGNKPEDIAGADLYFVDRIGLKEHLSPTRANGLVAMIKQMKLYALAFAQKEAQR
jgi:cysteine desulfuration protein SufE